jgi:phosphoribosylglycinamide formyltransferase 1
MTALVDALSDIPEVEFVAVISNVAAAPGLQLAHERGIPCHTLDHRDFPDRTSFDSALSVEIDRFHPDLLVLAGFMRILTELFVDRYAGRMLNIHPSLLPAYPGLHTHARALADGVSAHGATVHFVTPALDGGPGILQARVPVLGSDDEQSLASRVLQQEHLIYPQVLRWFAAGRVRLARGAVELDGRTLAAPMQYTMEPAQAR